MVGHLNFVCMGDGADFEEMRGNESSLRGCRDDKEMLWVVLGRAGVGKEGQVGGIKDVDEG